MAYSSWLRVSKEGRSSGDICSGVLRSPRHPAPFISLAVTQMASADIWTIRERIVPLSEHSGRADGAAAIPTGRLALRLGIDYHVRVTCTCYGNPMAPPIFTISTARQKFFSLFEIVTGHHGRKIVITSRGSNTPAAPARLWTGRVINARTIPLLHRTLQRVGVDIMRAAFSASTSARDIPRRTTGRAVCIGHPSDCAEASNSEISAIPFLMTTCLSGFVTSKS